MVITQDDKAARIVLSDSEAKAARESSHSLAEFGNGDELIRIIVSRESGEKIETRVPGKALHLIAELLGEMAKGSPVTVVPAYTELSTHQAAAILHVSRPFLIKLLESGKIPYRKVGAHRRIRYSDLNAYIEKEKKARFKALDELTAEAERLGLYE